MSRSIEVREVEQQVSVYRCDRCGTEMAPTRKFGESRPGEGASISAREYRLEERYTWLPLAPAGDDEHERYEAAHADLCPSCVASLLAWFGGAAGSAR